MFTKRVAVTFEHTVNHSIPKSDRINNTEHHTNRNTHAKCEMHAIYAKLTRGKRTNTTSQITIE